jgi:hypothetical protein
MSEAKSGTSVKKEETKTAPAATKSSAESKARVFDPVVERQKAQDERPYAQLEHRPPRQGVSRMSTTGTGGPQPPEVMEEMAKSQADAAHLAQAKAEVRAEMEAEERQKVSEKKNAKAKEAAEAREKKEKEVEAKAKERVEAKKKEAEKKAAEAKKEPAKV